MQNKSFLIFALGPVQDFIASARKCRDLWFGSWLLSEISRRVAMTIADECGEEALIFPGSGRLAEDEPVANKIVALVQEDAVRHVAEISKESCTRFLLEQVEVLLADSFSLPARWLVEKEVARRQVLDLIETFCVAVPCSATEGRAYTEARARAEALMAARKRTRDWGCSTWGGETPKSSLDGLREAVVRLDRGSGAGEYLCGVGLLKRFGTGRAAGTGARRKAPRFHSSSHVAAAPHYGLFQSEAVRRAFDEYLDDLDVVAQDLGLTAGGFPFDLEVEHQVGPRGTTSSNILDGAILFENRVIDLLEEMAEKKLTAAQGRRVVSIAQRFRDRAGLGGTVNPYYALVLADGDRMGKLIDRQTSFEKHRALSCALEDFATEADVLTAQHEGSLIYSGGDDVLALVPLHSVLDYARDLSEAFSRELQEFAEPDAPAKPTLSVGVAIAHHLVHFATVRRLAKRAEGLAKRSRNSLAILFDKRSGGERSVTGSWTPETGEPLDRRLRAWQDFLSSDSLPHGFIRELEDLALFAEGCERGQGGRGLEDVVRGEAERIMDRKRAGEGSGEPGLNDELRAIIRQDLADGTRGSQIAERVRSLASELTIALELRRATGVASDGNPREEVPA